jgi:hypothetical protein
LLFTEAQARAAKVEEVNTVGGRYVREAKVALKASVNTCACQIGVERLRFRWRDGWPTRNLN